MPPSDIGGLHKLLVDLTEYIVEVYTTSLTLLITSHL